MRGQPGCSLLPRPLLLPIFDRLQYINMGGGGGGGRRDAVKNTAMEIPHSAISPLTYDHNSETDTPCPNGVGHLQGVSSLI